MAIVQKRGRKKVAWDLQEYLPELLAGLKGRKKRYRRRLPRPGDKSGLFAQLPEWQQRRIIAAATAQYNADFRLELEQINWCEPRLVWGMDIAEYEFDGFVFNALQVIDLGSRIKFEPSLKIGAFTAAEAAKHLESLMQKHGAPLFLKRDNGGNLCGNPVEQILKIFAVLPLNSPPGYPQYNGAVEKAQGDLKRRTRTILTLDRLTDMAKGLLLYAINESNTTPSLALNGATPLEVWNRPFRKFDKFEREKIYKEIAGRALRSLNGSGYSMAQEVFQCAWRWAARTYMEEHGILALCRHGQGIHNA